MPELTGTCTAVSAEVAPSPPARLASLDAMRGLIMILMAIDHAAYHVAKRHPGEFWGVPLPEFPDAAAFVTRAVTHLCAPGFFFLMGTGVVFLAASRQRMGWSDGRVTRHLVTRGLLLIVLQQLLENPTWALGYMAAEVEPDLYGVTIPGPEGVPFLALAVLFALGVNLMLAGVLFRLPTAVVGAIALGAVLATQILTPGPEQASFPFSPIARILMIPGITVPWMVVYPVVPWLSFTALGVVFGRLLQSRRERAFRIAALAGVLFLIGFVAARVAGGFGNFHPPEDGGWIAFLNVTKYPPSLAFFLVTMGVNLLLLGALEAGEKRLGPLRPPLLVFGGTALFFYIAHLYVYLLLGLAFPRGAGLATMYAVWLVGLLVLYPLCRRYSTFRRSKPIESIWRLF